jgi:hypothetical protein
MNLERKWCCRTCDVDADILLYGFDVALVVLAFSTTESTAEERCLLRNDTVDYLEASLFCRRYDAGDVQETST